MENMDSDFGAKEREHVNEINNFIVYFILHTLRICRHLEKLDRLPLDQRFDFRMYFDHKEFVYSGDPDQGLTQHVNVT